MEYEIFDQPQVAYIPERHALDGNSPERDCEIEDRQAH